MKPSINLHHHHLLLILLLTPTILSQVHNDNLCPEAECSDFNCAPPACNCARFKPPYEIAPEWSPQFVLLTFNGVVKREFYAEFKKIFTKNRRNPSGIRITATTFVSDRSGNKNTEGTDYCLVQKLFEDGHEIASNSISHKLPIDYWRSQASLKEWRDELDGQRANLTKAIKLTNKQEYLIKGARAPWLQAGGDLMFRAEYISPQIKYDSSLVLQTNNDNGPYWPFTLNYNDQMFHCEGTTGLCPLNCYPGLWEVPIETLEGPRGSRCIHLDFCVPDHDENAIYAMLMANYHRRRNGNHAPLVISINNGWFERNENAAEGLIKFIDKILEEDDTFIVSMSQMLAWMQDPVPIDRLNEVPELYSLPKTEQVFCNTKRGTEYVNSFFISGNTMVILEVVILTVMALYLIAKDMD